MSTPKKVYIPAVILCLATYFLLAALTFDPKPSFGDDYNYIMLARSLKAGTGFTDTYLPVPKPHTHYPPGYP
ncbi:MAG TPA: hypothetical protein PLQ76_02235, partial [bacterium]|nr:hypothetical protein [bacterium]